jgi:transposase-like protein
MDLSDSLKEIAGAQLEIVWPPHSKPEDERHIRATISPPHRAFDVTLHLVQRGGEHDFDTNATWRCIGYTVEARDNADGLAELTVGEAIEIAKHLPAYFDAVANQLAFSTASVVAEAKAMMRRGRRGLPDHFFVAIAHEYRRHLAAGKPPTASIARDFDVGRSTAASWISGARKRGYLGPARPGEAGEAVMPSTADGELETDGSS